MQYDGVDFVHRRINNRTYSVFKAQQNVNSLIFLIIILFAVILEALMHISFIADNISGAKILTVGGIC